MPAVRQLLRSFSGGEVSPEFWGRVDQSSHQTGLAYCRNFRTLPHGPLVARPGTQFVREVKTSGKRTRLIPFVFSADQSFALEFGESYIRFHTQGSTLLSGTTPYEVATPYLEADLFDLKFVQSNDVLTITHKNYAPRELRRISALSWTLTSIAFASSLSAPSGVTATATGTGSTTYLYKVTAIGLDGLDQSLASSSASCTNNLLTTGNYNTVSWSAVTGAARYRVYKESNGLYGFIGQASGTSFKDDNIAADISSTPPEANNPFSSPTNYPAAVSYFEQRRFFAGTASDPSKIWATRSGTESSLTYSIPSQDADALIFRVAARELNEIRHLAPVNNLVALTNAAEWSVSSVNGDALTPSTTQVRPVTYIGANQAAPVIVGGSLLYVSARGGHLREFGQGQNGFVNGDLSIRASHLFDNFDIVSLAYSKAPYPTVWAVSTTGLLLGFTYVPEQQVGGWHQHDTAASGLFEDVISVPEGAEDVLYFVIQRTIDGASVRYVERMGSGQFIDLADAFFVDCGATYSGASTSTVSGLDWLEGQTVSVLVDGAEHPNVVVTSGVVTLSQPGTKVQVGLPITCDMQTLPMSFDAMAAGQSRIKNVNQVWLRVQRSSGIFAGPSFERLTEYKQRLSEAYGSPPDLVSDEIPMSLSPDWSRGGQVCVRKNKPLPLMITAMVIEAEIGG